MLQFASGALILAVVCHSERGVRLREFRVIGFIGLREFSELRAWGLEFI